MSSAKQYGLQIPKKGNPVIAQKNAVFVEDSDSDVSDKGNSDWIKKSYKRVTEKSVQKNQTKLDIKKALEEDSTVFQYDEVYDQLEQKKQDSLQGRQKDRKPRYIQHLINTAERRKIESERRIERQVQKEREAEGEEFKDKDTFVTSAYKKKLEEFAILDEEQKRQDMLEGIGDVTKQQDISGFYRHLYQTTLGPKGENKPGEKEPKRLVVKENAKLSPDKRKESRQYRKRKNSNSSDERGKDADTDKSSSSSSSSSNESDSDGEKSSESENDVPKRKHSKEATRKSIEGEKADAPLEAEIVVENGRPKDPEKSVWEKRTVGHAFDEALKRYMERKAVRAVH